MKDALDLGSAEMEIVGSLFKGCLDLLVGVWKAAKQSDLFSEDQNRSLYRSLERFLLWGDGFDVTNGALDVILARPKSSSLRNLILQLLSAVGHVLIDRFVAVVEYNAFGELKIQDHVLALTKLLGNRCVSDLESDGLYLSQNGDSDSEGSEVDIVDDQIDEIITNLATYIDCLCDSIPSIEQLASEDFGPSQTRDVVEQVFNHSVQAQSPSLRSITTITDPNILAEGVANERHDSTADSTNPKAVAMTEEKDLQEKMIESSKFAKDAQDLRPQKQMEPILGMTPNREGSISIIDDTAAITKLAFSLYSRIIVFARDAPHQFYNLCQDLGSIKGLLYHHRDQAHRDCDSSFETPIKVFLDQCFELLRELEAMVAKYENLIIASSGQTIFFKRFLWVQGQSAFRDLHIKLEEQQKLLELWLSASGSSREVVHQDDPKLAILNKSMYNKSNSATPDSDTDSVSGPLRPPIAKWGPIAGLLHHREKFKAHTKVHAAFSRNFDMEGEYSPEVWLLAATWWLVKSRTIFAILDHHQNRLMGASRAQAPSNSGVSAEQAFTDLLKSFWILEHVILDGTEDKRLAHSFKKIMSLAESLGSDLHEIEFMFKAQTILMHDVGLFESFEPLREAKGNILNAIDDPSASSRWFDVEIDDAGAMREKLLYRTFVNARLGYMTGYIKSYGAPYMLLLWTETCEDNLFISLCNQRGTVNLSRKIVPEDLDPIPSWYQPDLMTSIKIAFPSQDSEITFLSAQDMLCFWALPRSFFAAVKDRYPVPGELTIYRSPIVSYKEPQDLPRRSAVPDAISSNTAACGLQVHESMRKESWTTTRRLVVNSPPGAERPMCVSHWLPLNHVSIWAEESKVTVSWSDCGHLKRMNIGNFSHFWSYVHIPGEPDRKIHLEFESALQAREFEDCLLFPTVLSPWTTLKLTIPSAVHELRVYQLSDFDEADERYSAITSTRKVKGCRMTEIYFVYRDIDWHLTAQNKIPLTITFPSLGVPRYISTMARLMSKPTATDGEPKIKEVAMEQRSAHFRMSSEHDLVKFMLTLTGWNLVFFRAIPKISLAETGHLLKIAKEHHKNIDLQVWEKRTDEGPSRMQLCVRLENATKNRWITASLFEVPHYYGIIRSKHIVVLQSLIERGAEVDTKTMKARTRGEQTQVTRPATKKQWKIVLTFEDVSDHADFLRSSALMTT